MSAKNFFALLFISIISEPVICAVQPTLGEEGLCKDQLEPEACRGHLTLGKCKEKMDEMRKICSKTCGFCTPCEDRLKGSKCKALHTRGACSTSYRRMKRLCPRTCGFCAVNCEDQTIECQALAILGGNCTTNYDYMKTNCPSSCGHCGVKTPCDELSCPITKQCLLDTNMKPRCECNVKCRTDRLTGPLCGSNGTLKRSFPHLCALRREDCNSKDFYRVVHYGNCITQEPCHDEAPPNFPEACLMWQKKGACSAEREVMQFYCPKTCDLCRQAAPPPRCKESKFGCCWNKDDNAVGKFGKGCKACKDRKFCSYFKLECGNSRNSAHMREFCPGMCRYCAPSDAYNVDWKVKAASAFFARAKS